MVSTHTREEGSAHEIRSNLKVRAGIDLDTADLPAFRPKDYTADPGRVDHVKAELSKVQSKPGSHGLFSFILCPFHSERTPSGRVSHNPAYPWSAGNFKCYGCGATAKWDKLVASVGLDPFPDEAPDPSRETFVPTRVAERFSAFSQPEGDDLQFKSLTGDFARELPGLQDGEWRGFDLDWLASTVGAKLCYFPGGRYYVYLPVTISGVERGFIRAQLKKPRDKTIPSYINAPGRWSLQHGLFPYDAAKSLMRTKGLSSVVLVEGPRDALRLVHEGVPAVCILGTHSWTENKVRLLELFGASRAIVCFDGDAAGAKASDLVLSGMRADASGATTRVAPPLRSVFESVRRINLEALVPDGSTEEFDPGNVPWELFYPVLSKVLL